MKDILKNFENGAVILTGIQPNILKHKAEIKILFDCIEHAADTFKKPSNYIGKKIKEDVYFLKNVFNGVLYGLPNKEDHEYLYNEIQNAGDRWLNTINNLMLLLDDTSFEKQQKKKFEGTLKDQIKAWQINKGRGDSEEVDDTRKSEIEEQIKRSSIERLNVLEDLPKVKWLSSSQTSGRIRAPIMLINMGSSEITERFRYELVHAGYRLDFLLPPAKKAYYEYILVRNATLLGVKTKFFKDDDINDEKVFISYVPKKYMLVSTRYKSHDNFLYSLVFPTRIINDKVRLGDWSFADKYHCRRLF